jgi:hypothetical protein
MIRVTNRKDALDALESQRVVRCIKIKQNKRHGAFLEDGSRAADRGTAELVCHTVSQVESFYRGVRD